MAQRSARPISEPRLERLLAATLIVIRRLSRM